LSERLEQELARRTGDIFQLAGSEFNINSPKQLSEVLFDKLQLPILKRTGTSRAPSTAVEVLEELALGHELPRQILDWRTLMKLKGTYIDALPQLVNPETGRVHTCFNQAVAATGRLSSSDPNLQNIPIKTELGREIRRAFIADPGKYAPQYGGYCADGVSFGTVTTNIDPNAWRIIDGKLYLSYDPGAADGFEKKPTKVVDSKKHWSEVQNTLISDKMQKDWQHMPAD